MNKKIGYEPSSEQGSFKDLLDYNNPNLNKYLAIARQGNIGSPANAQYSELWIRKFASAEQEEIEKFIEPRLKSEVFVDLGAGTQLFKNLAINKFRASKYVAIDRHHNKTGAVSLSSEPAITTDLESYVEIDGDMLLTIARLRTGSVNFAVNGIDYTIIPDSEYHEALAKEMIRAVKPGGIIMGVNSQSLEYIERSKLLRLYPKPAKENLLTDRFIFYKDERTQ